MYEGNPGEIDFGSSLRKVQISQGSSYRESTAVLVNNSEPSYLTGTYAGGQYLAGVYLTDFKRQI